MYLEVVETISYHTIPYQQVAAFVSRFKYRNSEMLSRHEITSCEHITRGAHNYMEMHEQLYIRTPLSWKIGQVNKTLLAQVSWYNNDIHNGNNETNNYTNEDRNGHINNGALTDSNYGDDNIESSSDIRFIYSSEYVPCKKFFNAKLKSASLHFVRWMQTVSYFVCFLLRKNCGVISYFLWVRWYLYIRQQTLCYILQMG